MHLHYITLKRQSRWLNQVLQGATITDSFTQVKNEWVLELTTPDNRTVYWQLSSDPHYGYCVLGHSVGRRANSTDIFPEIVEAIIQDIALVEGERIITVHFTNRDLSVYLQFFPLNINFFLLEPGHQIVHAFKHNKRWTGQQYTLPAASLPDPTRMDPATWQQLITTDADTPLEQFLRKRLRYMTRPVVEELLTRAGLSADLPVGELTSKQQLQLLQRIRQLFEQFEIASPHVYFQDQLPERLTLGPFQSLSDRRVETFEELNTALRIFCFQSIKWQHLLQKRQALLRRVKERLKFLERTMKNLQTHNPTQRAEYYRKIGQLILAQPHAIQPGQTTAELVDYFSPDQTTIQIRIPAGKKPSEVAELYFQKARDSELNLTKRQQRLQALKKEFDFLNQLLPQLELATTEKALNKLEHQLKAHHILGTSGEEAASLRVPYKEFQLNGYTIWVGKSARDNDALTFKYAHKEDWWFHVQGYAGAHVIVRNPNRQDQLPPAVKEYAARLAVTFSDARHARYVPVLVTRVKYVRKPRKSPPGTVIPQRTETIFVDPLPEGTI